MKKIRNQFNRMCGVFAVNAMEAKRKLAERSGERSGEGYVDTAVKILIAVVLGALLLAGLYALFKDTVLPTLVNRIQQMFNYAG